LRTVGVKIMEEATPIYRNFGSIWKNSPKI